MHVLFFTCMMCVHDFIRKLYFLQDHSELEAEIERLGDNLKPKVAALHKLEGKFVFMHGVHHWTCYSETFDNGHSEKQTTSVQWTLPPPANHSIDSVHFYL